MRRWRAPILLLTLAAAGGLVGCAGDAGQAGGGLGIATTQAAGTTTYPTTTTDATTTTTTVAGTASRPTASTVPPAAPPGLPTDRRLSFRAMTLRLRAGWRATRDGADHVTVATGACRHGTGAVDCPGFLLLGPSQIAIADQLGPYDPERVWHPGAGVEGCPADRDGLAEQTPRQPRRRGFARVGTRTAVYREWTVPCLDAGTLKPKTSYRQRVWYLPSSRILVVDEWSTPGLGQVLAAAAFS
jgi:hypothetical protein